MATHTVATRYSPLLQTSQSPSIANMISQLLVASLLVLLAGVRMSTGQSQTKYRAYQGPPVVPVITKDGFLADTKEVADAKQYFLNALAKAAAEVKDDAPTRYTGSSQLQRVYEPVPLQPQYQQPQYQQPQYQQPLYQQQSLLHRARPLAATPAPYRPQPTRPAPVYEDNAQYDDGEYQEEPQYAALPRAVPTPTRADPNVTPVILENGYIADTHEVNAAKAEHFAAVARAQELVARAQQRAAQSQTAGGAAPQYSQAPAEY